VQSAQQEEQVEQEQSVSDDPPAVSGAPTSMRDVDLRARALHPHYARFRVAERLLMTGHSHQAWPDVAREGLLEAFDVAAERVDAIWPVAFARIEHLRAYLRRWYADPDGEYTPAASTHDLLVKWLSALDLTARPRIVTTDGEFHSIARQLDRLEEEGIEVVRVPWRPVASLAERVAAAVDGRTAAVMVSRVLYETALIVEGLSAIAVAARAHGAALLVDDYHGTNVVPWSPLAEGLDDAHWVIGGYKYLQWGQGNCFLRAPADSVMRPVMTGWFASFSTLSAPRTGEVRYDEGGSRFLGGTIEPASAFRAARVVDFFEGQGLDATTLRATSRLQVGALRRAFDALDLDPARLRQKVGEPIERVGGFLALEGGAAIAFQRQLAARGVLTDARGTTLRFGPAPYVTQAQIDDAMGILAEVVRDTAVAA
jgi:selenocysteine lyase/cysteine desulfurase